MGSIDSASAFQPATTRRPFPSSYLSSSVSKDAESKNDSISSPVRVVNAAALINGPAHAASLEQMARNDLPTTTTTTTTTPSTVESTQPLSPILSNAEEPTEAKPAPSNSPPRQSKTRQPTPKGPVTTVETIQELLAVMNCENEANKKREDSGMTLVLFHAHYCKICQRATMQLTKAAREYPSVNFAKVEAKVIPEPTAENLRTLGVSKFPFVQIYRRGDCVASFSTGPTHMFMRKVRGTLDLCLERDEECWNGFSIEFATEIQGNRDARKQFVGPELMP